MIRLDAITKEFPGVKALDGVCFDVRAGEVHALCGENGAGKSTLMKILAGIWPYGSYGGRILRDDLELRFHSVRHAAAAGIAIVHQELALMPEMTVLDNLFLGRELNRHGVLSHRQEREHAARHFAELGLDIPLDAPVSALGIGQQQRLEIARALIGRPSVLVLDEPTSALPEDDADRLLDWIRHLADQGTACVYISHRLDEVFRLADRVTVLRDGQTVWTKLLADTSKPDVIEAMVDRPPADLYAHEPAEPGDLLVELRDLRVERRGRPILNVPALTVRRGEIVGLAGMMGAGRTCLLRALAGALHGVRVTGMLNGRPLPATPHDAMRRGTFLIPEDRKTQALFLDESLAVNVTAATVPAFRQNLFIDDEALAVQAAGRLAEFGVKAPSPHVAAHTLSGGNQQKVLLCRAAEVSPPLLLLDEPTRGIDVGAKDAIYRRMEAWAAAGWGILWSSSELQEVLGLSDRLYVMANGQLAGELATRPFNETHVMHLATQTQTPAASHS